MKNERTREGELEKTQKGKIPKQRGRDKGFIKEGALTISEWGRRRERGIRILRGGVKAFSLRDTSS